MILMLLPMAIQCIKQNLILKFSLKQQKCLVLKQEDVLFLRMPSAGVEAALKAGMICIGIGEESVLKDAHMVISGLYEMDLDKLIALEKRLGYEKFI